MAMTIIASGLCVAVPLKGGAREAAVPAGDSEQGQLGESCTPTGSDTLWPMLVRQLSRQTTRGLLHANMAAFARQFSSENTQPSSQRNTTWSHPPALPAQTTLQSGHRARTSNN